MKGAIPARILRDKSGPRVEWLHLDGAPFSEPFLDDSLARLRRAPANERSRRPLTTLDALAACEPGLPLAGVIFHVSRCGSTLFTQLLGATPRHIVVSEPPIVDDILRSARHDAAINDEQRIAWLRGAMAALGGRQAAAEEKLFVKLDCWAIFELPLLRRAFPGVPLYFIHRHPLEVLASLMRMPSLALVRDTVLAAQMGLTAKERDRLTHEEHAAAVLGALFRSASEHRAYLIPVAYPDVAEFVRTRLLAGTVTEEEAHAYHARLTRSAKNPGQSFTPDTDDKRRTASPALIAACARWAEPPYQRWLQAGGYYAERARRRASAVSASSD